MDVLSQLELRDRYRSDYDSLLQEFYVPCLVEATSYSRGVGFFTAASLALAVDGIHALIEKQGKMRLVVSPQLNDEDVRAIAEGYEDREKVVERALIRSITEPLLDSQLQQLRFVSWLVENEFLDVKVAVTTRKRTIGTYHEKLGIFSDNNGNHVAFTGSANETANGFVGNFERIDVFRSWIRGDSERIPGFLRDFEDLWSNTTPGLRIVSFPFAVRAELLRFASPKYQSRNAPGTSTSASTYFNLVGIDLRARQAEAVERWRGAGCRGILEMATGTGKTIAALACAASVPDLKLLMVAVPTAELVAQWTATLQNITDFPAPIAAVGESRIWMERFFRKLHRAHDDQQYSKSLMPCIVGTYSALSEDKVSRLILDAGGIEPNSMLVCDEVHNTGAATYQNVLRDFFTLRLGLSATPVRKYDEDGNDAILAFFEQTVYSFDIGQAIAAEVLAQYDYLIYPIYLTRDEYAAYQDLSKKAAAAQSSSTTLTDELARLLFIKRANILKSAEGKFAAMQKLVSERDLRRGLVYAATIEEASSYATMAARAGLRTARYSSVDVERRRILNEFSHGRLDTLVSINCLDEGVDIPNAQVAVLASSDASERQFIQRRGRVLRTAPDKTHATIYDFIVLPPDFDQPVAVFRNELGRVAEFAKYSRNMNGVAAELTRLLQPYGLSVSEVLSELGQ